MTEPNCPTHNWRLTCTNCNVNDWIIENYGEHLLRLSCRLCGETERYALTFGRSGLPCQTCERATWNVVCNNDDHQHLKLQCATCEKVATVGLSDD